MVIPPLSRVRWSRSFRLIRSIYPPVDLFEDIADPADWELIDAAEAKTNPRARDAIGSIHLVPPERRVSGAGASWVMAPFCHVSPGRPSRFADGSYGVSCAGDRFEVALAETMFHFERFMAATQEGPATADYRELIGRLDAELHDLRDAVAFEFALDADDYAGAQTLARELRRNHASDGIVWPSVRHPGGEAIAAFWADVVGIPVQGRHLCYRWDGNRADAWLTYGEENWQLT
ncbi:MAG: RES family NAD+ phosphorylase [Alphaproteobacteria bacterium]|nr:RES family NAD+ phosphorylase [Alphaproteobacteria bacterium]